MSLRRAPALVTEQQAAMALRERPAGAGAPQRLQAEQAQEDAAVGDEDEFSSSLLPPASARDRRRRERGNKSKCKEMSEEEMMDLALRLSEREATVTASRLKQEEEAVMKAIKESMVNQTKTVLSSQSQSLLADQHADASARLCSPRKPLYSNGKKISANSDEGENCPTQTGEVKAGEENNNRNKKWKREGRGSLPEKPDLMQTQDVASQASPCSSESVSPQSSDSTQIDDCPLPKSPVFPLTGCRATVCMSRLSQDLLETCKVSGFVSCSQDSWIQKSLVEGKSPTFPKSPMNFPAGPKSPVYDGGDDGERMSPDGGGSPAFGSTLLQDQSQSAWKPQVCKNSGFTFSSQESFSFTGRSASCRPDSPVFPGSRPAVEASAICLNPVLSGSGSTSPVYGCTGRRRTLDPIQMNSSVVPLSAELRGSSGAEPSQSLQEETCKTDRNQDDEFKELSQSATADAQDSNASKGGGSAEEEVTSDMTLLWSDEEEDDVTPAGSSSPVFPEERPVRRTAADPETAGSECSWTSSRANKRASEPAAVHYYWGVPFCPRGLDPDKYTQVIVAQMEVYEKSLKQAQRCLLRKAEWGEPVLPRPENYRSPESPAESPRPQTPQRLRRKKRHESADTSAEEEEEEKETDAENKEDEKNDGGDGADDCEVCPETQLSDVTKDRQDAEARPGSPALPEAHRILLGRSPAAGVQEEEEEEEEMEVGGAAAPSADAAEWSGAVFSAPDPSETDGSWNAGRLEGERLEAEQLQRGAAGSAHMDCPLCQGSFPVTEIEVHAAYCDGELDRSTAPLPSPHASKPRRKRARRAEATDDDADGSNQEKCYICQRAVPLRDYSRHTELCIQRQAAKPAARGDLLSALERSEGGDSGAGPSRLQPGDVIDLRDDDDADADAAFRTSDSPIRSFTPISEATDCLVDLRRPERSKKPSRRRR
ncbi:BRCA1-A complex subunit RAP80 [Betta splendens]|uniref:BRCA1-A complex subunit RAP80 n=1 Tax=Betta splendens TaxID=158456 RepID=A0A9W2X8G4_BETSP|nr:BRCA1-A complex subunit RAP80 [Betta splendens]XP_055358096.1 BRCA1-A complex subunit RAP80 [Betta splendens]